ncbi:DUF4202 domain-containing protein [Pedobacter sp. SYSU D00535]|uniref:DUF4202 domain-containing protein n=1 Tax=Pedobacter sp. SYSU D00535 TaxID=2810308 RepID=UPI001A97607F|nr:DUF4202 domain-containing protein [Pedobacter sp. SYSU D00535]
MKADQMEEAFRLFDDYNKMDPNKFMWEGELYPAEYFYSLQLYNWVLKLDDAPSPELLLASRCQHIGRWEIARNSYPANKAGYLRWRADLAKYHATKAGEILRQLAFAEDLIEKVQQIVLKQKLKSDPDVQTMENALCLVFLQFQYEDFLTKHDDLKMIRILQKSWSKMDEAGHKAAFTLKFSERGRALIERALGS